jgi:hypothetical protein
LRALLPCPDVERSRPGNNGSKLRVTGYVTVLLTIVPGSDTFQRIKARPKGRRPVMPGGRGECGARGRGLINPAPGRLGHHVCRYYGRRVRCSLDWDRRRWVTPARPRPRKHGLGCASADVSRLARAEVERRQASAPDSGGAAQAALSVARPARRCVRDWYQCVCRRSASLMCRKRVLRTFLTSSLPDLIRQSMRRRSFR